MNYLVRKSNHPPFVYTAFRTFWALLRTTNGEFGSAVSWSQISVVCWVIWAQPDVCFWEELRSKLVTKSRASHFLKISSFPPKSSSMHDPEVIFRFLHTHLQIARARPTLKNVKRLKKKKKTHRRLKTCHLIALFPIMFKSKSEKITRWLTEIRSWPLSATGFSSFPFLCLVRLSFQVNPQCAQIRSERSGAPFSLCPASRVAGDGATICRDAGPGVRGWGIRGE